MLRWMVFIGVALIASGCSLLNGNDDGCEIPSPELVSKIESGLTAEGATLAFARASRSIAYDKMWFLAARVQGPGFEERSPIPIWGVNDLKNPDLIWWANDLAKNVSTWGDEEYFSSSTDGIGRARFCSDQASKE